MQHNDTNHGAFRVGILGCGNQAADHAAAYRELAGEGVQIVAVADVNLDRAVAFAEQHTDGAAAFASIEEMLDGAELDGVSICVPNKFHYHATMAVLRKGKNVLCEKPPALTVDEAVEMERTAQENDALLTYGVLYRHLYEYLLPFVQELGVVYHARAAWTRKRGIPGWGIYGNKGLQGGGAGIDLGVHVYDLAWWLMGRPTPRRVAARMFDHKAQVSRVGLLGPWDPEAFEVEDHMLANVDFAQARLDLEATFAADVEDEELATVELQGVHGRLVFRLMTGQAGPDEACTPVLYAERHGRLVKQEIREPLPMTTLAACGKQIANFVAASRGQAGLLVPAADGTAVQRVLDGMYSSAERNGEQLTI